MTYSFRIGLWKTFQKILIWFGPAILAFLANVPVEYAGVASILIYLLQNWLKNRD